MNSNGMSHFCENIFVWGYAPEPLCSIQNSSFIIQNYDLPLHFVACARPSLGYSVPLPAVSRRLNCGPDGTRCRSSRPSGSRCCGPRRGRRSRRRCRNCVSCPVVRRNFNPDPRGSFPVQIIINVHQIRPCLLSSTHIRNRGVGHRKPWDEKQGC